MILSSRYRISSKRIEDVKARGSMVQNPFFGVCIAKRDDTDEPRFAFVVSTKISKGSVHRNRINRSFHEGVRRSVYKVPKGYDFVFLAKKVLDKMSTEEIIREVENFLINLKLK